MNEKIILTAIFILAYASFVVFNQKKGWIAIGAALLSILFTSVTLPDALRFMNLNILGLVAGTLLLSELFILSKVPARMADILIDRSPNLHIAMLSLCAATGLVSIVLENVAALLLLAPVAFSLAKKAKISPVPLLIGMTVSSNLQGTATLIGDPPSMIMAAYSRMTFNDFFFYQGRISIFFFVQMGALVSLAVLAPLFRKHKAVVRVEKEPVTSWIPFVLLGSLVAALAVSSHFDRENRFLAGLICMVLAVAGLLWARIRRFTPVRDVLARFDWDTLFFLIGVFILVGGMERTGLISETARLIGLVSRGNILLAFTIIIGISVLLSGFIDNVPYVTVMLPVAGTLAAELGVPAPLLIFGLVIGACLGGNITPFGATANIVTMGLLKKNGHPASFGTFVRIGLPFTLAAVTASSVFLWLVWSK